MSLLIFDYLLTFEDEVDLRVPRVGATLTIHPLTGRLHMVPKAQFGTSPPPPSFSSESRALIPNPVSKGKVLFFLVSLIRHHTHNSY